MRAGRDAFQGRRPPGQTPNQHRGSDADRPRRPENASLLRGTNDSRGRSVADRRAHRQRQRPGHLAGRQHVVGGHRILILSLGIECRVPMVLRGYLGDVALDRSEAMHVISRERRIDVPENGALAAVHAGAWRQGEILAECRKTANAAVHIVHVPGSVEDRKGFFPVLRIHLLCADRQRHIALP